MTRRKRICNRVGCHALTTERYCPAHADHKAPRAPDLRGSASSRGYGSWWRKARLKHLAAEPLCRYCIIERRVVAATVVDHIIPHRGDEALLKDPDNWQSLCKPCHDKKTRSGL